MGFLILGFRFLPEFVCFLEDEDVRVRISS